MYIYAIPESISLVVLPIYGAVVDYDVSADAKLALPSVSSYVSPYSLKKSDMAILISTVSGRYAERNVSIPTLAQELQNSLPDDDINDVFLRTHQRMRQVSSDQTPRYESTMIYKLNLNMIFKSGNSQKLPSLSSTLRPSTKSPASKSPQLPRSPSTCLIL